MCDVCICNQSTSMCNVSEHLVGAAGSAADLAAGGEGSGVGLQCCRRVGNGCDFRNKLVHHGHNSSTRSNA
jgi:hypothetical protein